VTLSLTDPIVVSQFRQGTKLLQFQGNKGPKYVHLKLKNHIKPFINNGEKLNIVNNKTKRAIKPI